MLFILSAHLYTARPETALLKTIKTHSTQTAIFPALSGIAKIQEAILGLIFFIQRIPSKPQNTEYSKQILPFRLNGILE